MNKYIFLMLLVPLVLIASTNSRALYIKKYKNESKTALIIGNGTYGYFSNLNNAINDAKDMKNLLEQKGFKVHYLRDATLRQMDKTIDKFTKDLKKGGVGLVYFAGHGIEVDGKNYLIPIDTELRDKSDLKYDALPVNKLIDRMENAKNRLNILVLDACRNDPFSRSGGGGLAAINNAKGMYVAYATAPGEVASDGGASKNGLFTKHLIKEIKKPQPLESVFKNTRVAVMKESKEKQLPWTSSSVMGDFYFTIPNKEYLNSNISFNDEKENFYSLTINTKPFDAIVEITNIEPKYYNGIKLKSGIYNIKVSKDGYIAKIGKIELKSDLTTIINLNKKNITTSHIKKNTWEDSRTLLMWEVKVNNNYFKAKETKFLFSKYPAKEYCENLSLEGYSDWRLPTKNEMITLADKKYYYQDHEKTIQTRYVQYTTEISRISIKKELKSSLENIKSPNFWTSSENSDGRFYRLSFFGKGYSGWHFPRFKAYVRCVRNK